MDGWFSVFVFVFVTNLSSSVLVLAYCVIV
jgi:hypothetical protein